MTGSLVYDETSPRSGGFAHYDRIDATGGYLRHFANLAYLEFIASNAAATWQERQQAEKEIPIAKRKMAYHQNHPNFDRLAAERGQAAIKRNWNK